MFNYKIGIIFSGFCVLEQTENEDCEKLLEKVKKMRPSYSEKEMVKVKLIPQNG